MLNNKTRGHSVADFIVCVFFFFFLSCFKHCHCRDFTMYPLTKLVCDSQREADNLSLRCLIYAQAFKFVDL